MKNTHNVHALGMPREEVSQPPAWGQAIHWAGLGSMYEIRKLRTIPNEEHLWGKAKVLLIKFMTTLWAHQAACALVHSFVHTGCICC